MAIQQGDIDAGRGYLEQDLAIARQLAELEPGSATNAVDVALSLRALSDIDPDRERTLLGEAETILASLQGQERLPPNAEALLGKVRTRLAE